MRGASNSQPRSFTPLRFVWDDNVSTTIRQSPCDGEGIVKAVLLLEDGTCFEGRAFGAPGQRCGEVVFNTSMCGYQEILTDPSYRDQIITMTYPLEGNYGVNPLDVESGRVQAAGFIVKENCAHESNFRSTSSLSGYLKKAGVTGIENIDTRMLVRH